MIEKYRPRSILILVALLAAALLAIQFDDALLGTDFAQTASVANNLLTGNGLSTSLIYYEAHYQLGDAPVPQTVFPPGYAIMLAIVAISGISFGWSAYFLCLVSFVLTGFLIAASIHGTTARKFLAVLLGTAWLVTAVNWANVLDCRSEAIFIFFTTGSVYCIARWETTHGTSRPWLLGAASFAAGAFLLRYQGAFFILSISAVFFLRALSSRKKNAFFDLLAVAMVPGIVAAGVFLHNLILTGNFAGGPMGQVQHGSNPAQAAVAAYHELSKLLGVSKAGLAGGGPSEVLFVLALLVSIYVIARYSLWRSIMGKVRSSPTLQICLAYIIVTIVVLVYLSSTKSVAYMQARYLSTMMPSFLILLAAFGGPASKSGEIRKSTSVFAHSVLLLAFLAGQLNAGSEQLNQISTGWGLKEVRRALQAQYLGGTVQEFLTAEIGYDRHVLAHRSQVTGMVVDGTVFGLPPSLVSSRSFDADEILSMSKQFNLHYLVFYPKMYNSKSEQNSNRIIFSNIQNNNVPEWLELRLKTEDISLYEIVKD